ncbi:unnamed protein product [Rotaria sp. Silwood1]|nr:unnamed protein product [Rotaria sp. Silwood1]
MNFIILIALIYLYSYQNKRGVALGGTGVAWTNGVVPYEIASGYNSAQETFIIAAMEKLERLIAINNVQCIRFRPRISSDPYYITIVRGSGCSSYVSKLIIHMA